MSALGARACNDIMITAVAHRECQHVQGGGEARNLTGNVSIHTSEEGEGEGEASGADHLATALYCMAYSSKCCWRQIISSQKGRGKKVQNPETDT